MPVTYPEFLDWCDEDTLAEWVDGKIVMTSTASLPHQNLGGFLYVILDFWVQAYNLGAVIQPPFQMHLPPPVNRGREPDLIFVARSHLDRLHPTYLEGPADLVVEVTSPESVRRDRIEKFSEYERAGIPEYWLFDLLTREPFFYRLGADGRYHMAQVEPGGAYESRVLQGLRLPVAWLWDEPRPNHLTVLRSLGLLS